MHIRYDSCSVPSCMLYHSESLPFKNIEEEKCFKKIDEGVELFEETMGKMHEANSDNQREKYQDDLKKEIKKLQRLRDQVKNWQNSSDIKDKERLNQYRKTIEQRMEQFKDIERENKTKPHSKQGLSAEEKLDPKEKEKSDTIEWLQNQIRELSDESDRTESHLESISSGEGGKRKNKDKGKESQKKLDELRKHLERMKFHIEKLEICMRMVNNESLESKRVMEVLKDPLEMYIDVLDPDYDRAEDELENLDPEEAYEELNLGLLSAQLGTNLCIHGLDDEKTDAEPSVYNEGEEKVSSRHGSTDAPILTTPSPASPAPRRAVVATLPAPIATPSKLPRETSTETPGLSAVTPATPPPPPPGIPYNSVAAGRAAPAAATPPSSTVSAGKASFPIPAVARQPTSAAQAAAAAAAAAASQSSANSSTSNDENRNPVNEVSNPKTVAEVVAKSESMKSSASNSESSEVSHTNGKTEIRTPVKVMNGPSLANSSSSSTEPGESPLTNASDNREVKGENVGEDTLRGVLRQPPTSKDPKRAHIPAWLGASPLGRAPATQEHDIHLAALEAAFQRAPLPMDSEKPRTYLPKILYPGNTLYPQNPPPNSDTLEYYLRLSPETLFFIFYYMEGTKAQLLAAKALKKLSWRFHTKYLTWFQRHEEPKQITDDFEQGTYVYFDFERWSQRKKEAFTFEYRFLEDKDFD
ncbi:unnamed protein product [Auanema sp. JU1783]|nr:unnamed protein product [Auanema sp. JU1783]